LELIQWILVLALGGVVAFLWKDRRENRVPPWLRDMQQDDWVTRAQLDQYHLHVIQMSQAQRELINARFDELSKHSLEPGDAQSTSVIPPAFTDETVTQEITPAIAAPSAPAVEPPAAQPSSPLGAGGCQPFPVSENEPLGLDAPSRAISLFHEGKSIDQIAQELRIGRQEAQLLIRMAQHKPPSLAGV